MGISVNLSMKPKISRFYPRPDPPKSPESKGDFDQILVPPLRRGARGDLSLVAKQPSLTTFELVIDSNRN